MSIEAMKLALEALQFGLHVGFDESSERQIQKGGKAFDQHNQAITALRQAIEQAQKQEPVIEPSRAQLKQILDNLSTCHVSDSKAEFLRVWIRDWTAHKLRTSPPQRKPLTDEEIEELMDTYDVASIDYARAIEAVHGIKE